MHDRRADAAPPPRVQLAGAPPLSPAAPTFARRPHLRPSPPPAPAAPFE
jgi:hypothetical protein